MATLFKASGGTIGSLAVPEAWAAPNGLFPTTDRNDSSAYSWTSSTSTVTLPSSGLADGYLIVGAFEYEDSSNGRFNPQGKFVQASGTGTFVGGPSGGYSRDTSEDRAYVRCWAFVDGPSASATFQFQWKADVDDAGTSDGTVRSELQVIPLYYADAGVYSSTSASLYGGTTPNQVTGFTGTDGTNITITSNVVSVTGDNKRYLVLGSQFFEGRGGRTQRWHGLRIDGTKEDAAKAYSYYRSTSDDESGDVFTWLLETATATVTIDQFCYRGDGVSALQGGADIDGSTPAVGDHALVVLELNDSAEVFSQIATTQSSLLATTGPIDLSIATVAGAQFSDSASFARASDTGMNSAVAMDGLFGANVSVASNAVANTTRWTAYAELTIDGVEDADSFAGDYMRNNQGTTDTFGWSANLLGFEALALNEDIGVSVTELSGSEGGGAGVSPANWTGFWGINLDTLEVSASGAISGSVTIALSDSATASAIAEIQAAESITLTPAANLDLVVPFEVSLSSNITASGENTTSRLTGGGTFGGGRIQDDENPADAINLASDESGEWAWVIKGSGAEADSLTYDFRLVLSDDTALDTYTETAQWTIEVGGAIAAAVTVTFSDTATLAGKGDLTGTTALTFEDAATLYGIAQINASETITFTPTAQILGGGYLAGAQTLTFADSATLAATGQLQGVTTATFGDSATITANGELQGAVIVTFSDTATLVGKGLIASTGSITFADNAVITGIGLIQSSIPITFSVAASLAGTGALQTAETIVFNNAANLVDAGANPIAASESITFANAATIAGTGELTASESVVFSDTASISGGSAISASESIVVAQAAVLAATGELKATDSITLTAIAQILGGGALAGVESLNFSDTATLAGLGDLTATTQIDITTVGNMVDAAGGQISASETITLSATGTLGAIGALLASDTVTISATGTMISGAPIQGATSLQFALAGDLNALGDLTGSTDLTFSLNGDLLGTGELLANEQITFADAGILTGVGSLSTSVVITITGIALLSQGGIPIPAGRIIKVIDKTEDITLSAKPKNITGVLPGTAITVSAKGKTINVIDCDKTAS